MLETYFEQSISAYKLINEVTRSLQINEAPEMSVLNGNVGIIISKCIQIIDKNYEEKRIRELLKYYVAHSFFEDYDLEKDEDYSDEYLN
jgi:hypothetical protein